MIGILLALLKYRTLLDMVHSVCYCNVLLTKKKHVAFSNQPVVSNIVSDVCYISV
jgi:hypothetical protein